MNTYALIRPLLFSLDAETAHTLTLSLLKLGHHTGLSRLLFPNPIAKPVRLMGLEFCNPVGLAAGLDKNGDYIEALGALGFGHIEIGTVTPRPQPGNPQPRLFRLPEHDAIINRMGFNNRGVDHLVEQVKKARFDGIMGINIGKNFDTPIESALQDYLIGLEKVYPYADYITINISSPNTKNLRQLQQGDEIRSLLVALKAARTDLHARHNRYVPLVIKIAPDLDDDEIAHIGALLLANGIDGVIATNTTIARDQIEGHPLASEAGGLSGKPVKARSTEVVKKLASILDGRIPIIAAGGVSSPADALEKLSAGASLVQVYTGLIYQGPGLIKAIVEAC